MKKIEITLTVEIDEAEWAKTYGMDECRAASDARQMYGELAARRIEEHPENKGVVAINGKTTGAAR